MTIYRWLLRIAAPALAREYGEAMEETLAARLGEARGVGARLRLAVPRVARRSSRWRGSERFGIACAPLSSSPPRAGAHESGSYGYLGPGNPAGGEAATAESGVYLRVGADHGARHRRQRGDLRGRRAGRDQSAAVSGIGSIDRARSRFRRAAGRQRHGQYAGHLLYLQGVAPGRSNR